MAHTSIEWTDATWNPVTGCTKVSPGCAHCYAERLAPKVFAGQEVVGGGPKGKPIYRPRAFTDVMTHEARLDQPLHWRKPRRVFVNSMSDLFHEDVPDAFIDRVFAVMALAPQHTFQILTKRAERLRAYFANPVGMARVGDERYGFSRCLEHEYCLRHLVSGDRHGNIPDRSPGEKALIALMHGRPLPNVWLGVSVENQRFADERIPLLLETPAAVRFISAEPLLGPVSLYPQWMPATGYVSAFPRLDWVIVGGESGPGARPFDLAWARSIVSQCQAAGVPVFVKQLGANAQDADGAMHGRYAAGGIKHDFPKLLNRKGGDPAEWPEDLRVREFPMRMKNHCAGCGRYTLVDNTTGRWLCRKCGQW